MALMFNNFIQLKLEIMSQQKNQTAFLLSVVILFFSIIASAGGLLIPDLYRDNDFVKSAWFTNDLITLIVVSPLLGLALWFAKKGSLRWQLVWMGMLGYIAYNFAFYLFGAVFNSFFLLYTALFSLSAAALIFGLANLDITHIAQQFSPKTPVKGISIYLLVIAVMLFLVEGGMISGYLFTGVLPETIVLTGHPTSIVFALEMSIVVPTSAIAAVLLWKRHAWGYVIGVIMLLKGFTYGLVLCLGTALLAYSPAYGKWDPLMPFYIVVVVGGVSGCWVLLKRLQE